MKNKKGFTLIEILVVITIIALITSVAAVTYTQLGKQSRDSKRKADLEQIRAALEMYRSNSSDNSYTTDDYDGNCSGLSLTGYIGTIPADPKSTYNYYCDIDQYDYTIGAYLETGGSGSCGGCGSNCNYCVGPYGEE